MKGFLALGGGIFLGKFVAERFILKNPVTGSGFVEVADGFGLDDAVVVLAQVGGVLLARKLLKVG